MILKQHLFRNGQVKERQGNLRLYVRVLLRRENVEARSVKHRKPSESVVLNIHYITIELIQNWRPFVETELEYQYIIITVINKLHLFIEKRHSYTWTSLSYALKKLTKNVRLLLRLSHVYSVP